MDYGLEVSIFSLPSDSTDTTCRAISPMKMNVVMISGHALFHVDEIEDAYVSNKIKQSHFQLEYLKAALTSLPHQVRALPPRQVLILLGRSGTKLVYASVLTPSIPLHLVLESKISSLHRNDIRILFHVCFVTRKCWLSTLPTRQVLLPSRPKPQAAHSIARGICIFYFLNWSSTN